MGYRTQQVTPDNPLYPFDVVNDYLKERVPGFNYRTYETYLRRLVFDVRTLSGLSDLGVDAQGLEMYVTGRGEGVPYVYGTQMLELPEIDNGRFVEGGIAIESPWYPEYYQTALQDILNETPAYLFKEDFNALVRAIPVKDQEFIIATFSPSNNIQEGIVRDLNDTSEASEDEGDTPSETPLTWYKADSMARRRPEGDYFLVEMVAPTGVMGRPERVDIEGPEGVKISSLKLNMSPASLVINGSKIISRTQTLTRWVEEHWGDEMDMVNFNGSTFAFIRFPGEGERVGGGLCVESRGMTEPFKELQHLVNIYKMNGAVYQQERIDDKNEVPREFFNYANPSQPQIVRRHPRVGFIKQRLYIRIRCDFAEFIGFFESFDVTEDASSPYALNYNVSFKSEYTRWL
jgi:hypothetical protein